MELKRNLIAIIVHLLNVPTKGCGAVIILVIIAYGSVTQWKQAEIYFTISWCTV
jgi:hypothetical protein